MWLGLLSVSIILVAVTGRSVTKIKDHDLFGIPNPDSYEDLLDRHAQYMLGNMNLSVNPCEDFYEYACGNWKNNVFMPELERNASTLDFISVRVGKAIKEYLKDDTVANDNSGLAKAKRFYKSCTTAKPMKIGYLALMEILNPIEKKFLKKDSDFDWIDLNGFSFQHSVPTLIPVDIYGENNKIPQYIYLTINRHHHLMLNATTIKEDFELTNSVEELEELFTSLTIFRKKLNATAKFKPAVTISLKQFYEDFSKNGISWSKFFNATFQSTVSNKSIVQTNYVSFRSLGNLIRRSDKTLVWNYVKWSIIDHYKTLWEMVDSKPQKGLHENCVRTTELNFGYTLFPWYINLTMNEEKRAAILEMAIDIKDTFYNTLPNYKWLDDDTISEARTKLSAMDIYTGFEDNMRHSELADEFYSEIEINDDDFYDNLKVANELFVRKLVESIGKVMSYGDSYSFTTNAMYNTYLNSVKIFNAITLLPFYHKELPLSLRYSGLGSIIAHEIIHGFDSDNILFNYNGDKQQWWTNSSLRNFKERYRCLESQYNRFILNGTKMNGAYILPETVAENGGVRLAYQAYLAQLNKSMDNEFLSGLDFTSKQLFFLNIAQTWCSDEKIETRMQHVGSGSHPENTFRVFGTLTNMKEFSEEFKCLVGTGMNPLKKCIVW